MSLIGGQTYQLDSPRTLLLFKPLSLYERLRMGLALAYLKVASPNSLEGQTAHIWLQSRMGSGYHLVFEPLLTGKFGQVYDKIALPWFWARIHDRTTQLGYLRGGFQLVYDALVERITQLGNKVLLNTAVEQVEQHEGRWQVQTSRGTWQFDRVISTLPDTADLSRSTCATTGIPCPIRLGTAYGDTV